METIRYFALVRKTDGIEVYSSPEYIRDDGELDLDKIRNTLNFYFLRVNSGIGQQMENPKLTDEQKQNLKFLDVSDYLVKHVNMKEHGCFQKVWWTKEALEFLNN